MSSFPSQAYVSVVSDTINYSFSLARKIFRGISPGRAQLICLPSALLATTAMISAPPPATAITAYYGDSMYTRVDGPTWQEAQANAVILGGNLVTINDSAENDFISQTFSIGLYQDYYYIGFLNDGNVGQWRWISNEPVTFVNWAPGEPNNLGDPGVDENWAHIYANGQWNDIDMNDMIGGWGGLSSSGGIAEIKLGAGSPPAPPVPVPDPAVTSVPGPLPILGIGAVFVWSRRLRSKFRTQNL